MNEQEWLSSEDPAAMLDWLTAPCAPSSDRPRIYERRPSDRKLRLFACACHLALGAPREVVDRYEKDGWPSLSDQDWAHANAVSPETEWKVSRSHRAAILRDIVGNPFRPVTLPPGKQLCPQCKGSGCDYKPCDLSGRPCKVCNASGRVSGGPCPWLTPTVLSLAQAAYEERGGACGKCGGEGSVPHYSGMYRVGSDPCRHCRSTGRIDDGTLDPFRLALLADTLEDAGCGDVPCPKCMPDHQTESGYGLGWVQCQDDHGYFNVGCKGCGGDGRLLWGDGGGVREPFRGDGKEGTGRVPHPLLTHLRSPGPHVRGCWAVDLILGRD